jgi:histidinol dehydrogenase
MQAGDPALENIMNRHMAGKEAAAAIVAEIIKTVREQGDRALCAYTADFDQVKLTPGQMKVIPEEIEEAYGLVEKTTLESICLARDNIASFHRKQLEKSWFAPSDNGVILGQLVRPLARAGIYVPGGTAVLFSSVLMNAIPAMVAGVKEIVMVTPPGKDGKLNPYTLVAAAEAGVTEIYKAGGAQAIAALAYGTETIKPVDKITGPGNIYVTLAKQQVYGQVGIDMLAGPSEVLVVADETADASYVAADLLSQAEHDVLASAVLLTPVESLAEKVREEVARQTELLPRRDIVTRSLTDYSAIVITRDLAQAVQMANRFAPEHLELMVKEPFNLLCQITNAGAVFLGSYSPEPVGDYWAGPNHVLPTGGTARFYSPLSVDTFIKKSSIISYTREALEQAGGHIADMAVKEGLDAHANAIRIRLEGKGENQ